MINVPALFWAEWQSLVCRAEKNNTYKYATQVDITQQTTGESDIVPLGVLPVLLPKACFCSQTFLAV